MGMPSVFFFFFLGGGVNSSLSFPPVVVFLLGGGGGEVTSSLSFRPICDLERGLKVFRNCFPFSLQNGTPDWYTSG